MSTGRIKQYVAYGLGFDILESTMVAYVRYPKGWRIVEPENENIKTASDDLSGKQYYWMDNNLDLDVILDAIDNTIELNKDLEARYHLLNEKITELKGLFIERDLDELKTLEFTFKKPTVTKKGKKKKDEEQKTEIKVDNVTGEVSINKDSLVNDSVEYYIPPKEEGENVTEAKVESDIDKKIAAAMNKKKSKTGE